MTAWVTREAGIDLDGATIALQGFGNVGSHAALYLARQGAKVVAISDRKGGIYSHSGLAVEAMYRSRVDAGNPISVTELEVEGEIIDGADLLTLDVDILVPAAIEGVLHGQNADQVQARLIVEGANLPTTCAATKIFQERGIPVVPDILANTGGVTVSYLEWVQNRQRYRWEKDLVNKRLEEILYKAWECIRQRAKADQSSYRQAAYVIAAERVRRAIELRGF